MDERLAVGESHTFVVVGKPAPGGSKGLVRSPHAPSGWAVRPDSKRSEPWMKICRAIYRSEWGDSPPLDCPIEIAATFYFEPPKRANPDDWPLKSGNDVDKLLRASLDPLGPYTDKRKPERSWSGVIVNDRRIVRIVAERRFGTPERAEITLTRLPTSRAADPLELFEPVGIA